MNLKNQPTVVMPPDRMYDIERKWGMSKAAWMDVAWSLMRESLASDDPAAIEQKLRERAELILMSRKQAKDAA